MTDASIEPFESIPVGIIADSIEAEVDYSSLLEVLPTPEVVDERKLTAIRRIGSVLRAAKEDIIESKHSVQTAAIGVGVLGMQGLARAQASWASVPTIAIDVLKDSHSPIEAAAAGGSAFAAYCLAQGGATGEGLLRYPKAVTEFEQEFPNFVNFFVESLPGYERTAPPEDGKRRFTARRIGNTISTSLRRGATVAGIGSVAYVGTAAARGMDRIDVHKLNLVSSLDGGIVTSAFIYGVGKTIVEIGATHPQLAERIQNDASNVKIWYGVAAAMVGGEFLWKKIANIRIRNEAAAEVGPETIETEVSEQE